MGLKRIPRDQIVPNPDQPRKHFDEQALRELAGSILARGLKQPIAVRPIPGSMYQIVMGAHSDEGDQSFRRMATTCSGRSRPGWRGCVRAPLDA